MDFETFENWLKKLSKDDRDYLEGHPVWKKEYLKAKEGRSLPRNFVERTMEVLEGGSESET